MKVLREYTCACGNLYEGYHYHDEAVRCIKCDQIMTRIWSSPMAQVGTEESRLNNKAKDIEMGVYEKQGINLSNPGKDPKFHSGIDYKVD